MTAAQDLATARAALAALQSALTTGAGIVSVLVDGVQTTYASPRDLTVAIRYWQSRVNALAGNRPRASRIKLN